MRVAGLAIMARMSVMPTLTFRNRDGELVDVPTVAATRFKKRVRLDLRGRPRSVGAGRDHQTQTRRRRVLMSYAEFEALTKANTPALDDLSSQFDQLLESMQTPQSRNAMAAAFDATPERLGGAAVQGGPRQALARSDGPQGPNLHVCMYSPGSTAQAKSKHRRRHDPGVRRRLLQSRRGRPGV